MKLKRILLPLFIIIPLIAHAHGGKKDPGTGHPPGKIQVERSGTESAVLPGRYSSQNPERLIDWLSIRLPTLHPVVIHFPIMMLLLAFPLFFLVLLFKKEEFRKLSIVICGIGFLGGLAAATVFHPHTTGLPAAAARALEYHDFFAEMTLTLSGAATLAGFSTVFKKYRKKAVELIALALILLAVISVSLTGHFGGILAYVYGVGTEGKYLEQEDH